VLGLEPVELTSRESTARIAASKERLGHHFHEDGRVKGIATGDMGIGFGSNDPRYYADGGGVDQEFIPGHNSRALPFDQDGDVATGMGDGSGVDDTVPAYLSDGEYVIPADVVRKKGEEFFDKLVEKYHTPAAQQRGAQ